VQAILSSNHRADALVDVGIEPSLAPEVLVAHGITPAEGAHPEAATLVELVTPQASSEYWLGYRNFYVITRYNKSSFYAMAVFELATAIRNARLGR
jgi:membrane-bound lytic murein transglycosylase B